MYLFLTIGKRIQAATIQAIATSAITPSTILNTVHLSTFESGLEHPISIVCVLHVQFVEHSLVASSHSSFTGEEFSNS